MTREDALTLILKHHKTVARVFDVLLQWDPDKTRAENAVALRISEQDAQRYAARYGLKAARGRQALRPQRELVTSRLDDRARLYMALRVAGVSDKRIAATFRTTVGRVRRRLSRLLAKQAGNPQSAALFLADRATDSHDGAPVRDAATPI